MDTSHKQQSHDRIMEAAGRSIRRAGFHEVGVADIMKVADLPHDGLYGYFASRNALLAEAMDRTGRDSNGGGEGLCSQACARSRSLSRARGEPLVRAAPVSHRKWRPCGRPRNGDPEKNARGVWYSDSDGTWLVFNRLAGVARRAAYHFALIATR